MGRNAPHRERRTERPFPRRHERNARAWAQGATYAAPENRERRTENGTPLRGDGRSRCTNDSPRKSTNFLFPQRRKRRREPLGLHRSLCGFAADRARRPPVRALSVSWSPCPSPVYRALLHLLNLLHLLLGCPCHSVVLVGTSQTYRGCRENFSLPGRGAAPHSQASKLLNFQTSKNASCVR